MILLVNYAGIDVRLFAEQLARDLDKPFAEQDVKHGEIETFCESNAVDMLIVTCQNKTQQLQKALNACRSLRIPYLILTPDMQIKPIEKGDEILIPVTMFEEEQSKAQIATSFGRFCGTRTTLVQANDYGTRAAKNVGKITALIEKFSLPYKTIIGKRDSYKVEAEAQSYADTDTRMIVISASRDYGIDDLLFGPKERHILQKAALPVLLLNPRGDLYSLCD